MMRRGLALFLLLAAFAACGRREQTSPVPGEAPPVILISVDTLRSDHLPAYGYRGVSTPAIDALRKDSILFERAFSHCPQTLPSHASIMTGLLPPQTGVRDNVGYRLDTPAKTLAEVLSANGYDTGAAVSSYVLRRATGINRGFEFFDDEMDYGSADLATSAQRDGSRTAAALEQWIGSVTNRKLFAFLHLYEPHAPYEPPAKYANQSVPYDGEIAYVDSIVGSFVDDLKKRGLYDDALIIFLSDHGEGLGDHGEEEHGIFLYREAIQVPLMIKLPHGARRGETDETIASLVDIVPTVLAKVGMNASADLAGVDLLGDGGAGPRQIYSETYFPLLHLGWHELASIVDGNLHYIDAPRLELYDYAADPHESRNVADSNRRVVAASRAQLQKMVRPFQQPGSVDPEDQRKLAALGYIGSSAAKGDAGRPDPKDMIHTLDPFKVAIGEFRRGNDAKTIAILQRFLKDNPSVVVDAYGLLSQAYERSGQKALAVGALQDAMRRFPGDSHVALALANVLFRMGRFTEAKQHAELAIRENGVLAHEILAQVALAQKDTLEAEKQAQAALAEAPDRTTTLSILAGIRKREGNYQAELEYLDRAARAISTRHLAPIAGLQYERGEANLQLGRAREAEAAFREETRAFPKNMDAWCNLAVVVGAGGRREESREILKEAIAHNPSRAARSQAAEALEVMGDHEGAAAIR